MFGCGTVQQEEFNMCDVWDDDIAAPDEPEDVEYTFSDQGDIKEDVEYYDIEQHPRAKKIHEKYDVTHIYKNLSVAEKVYFDENYGYLEYNAFFNGNPVHNYKYYGVLQHNIRAYTIYRLMTSGKIKLYSFDSTAALTSLKISPKEEIIAPNTGTFVLEYGEIVLLLKIRPMAHTTEWGWYAKTAKDFSKFNKFFRKSIVKYNQYQGKVFDNGGNFINLPDVSFKDIFLPQDIREAVQKNIIDYIDLDKLEIKRKNGLPTKRGIIMAGEPGTGKTFLSRVLARTLQTSFMVITNLRTVGDLDDVFVFAKMFDRIIVLFEDIDIYIGNRDQRDIVSAMLNKLDGLEVNNHLIVLCTTNNLEVLDKALKDRPGRFDRTLYFNPPNTLLKIEMLKGFCEGKKCDEVDFKKVVEDIPKEYTGAYLKELYIMAVTEAIDTQNVDERGFAILTTNIFRSALKKLRKIRKEKSPIGFSDVRFEDSKKNLSGGYS